MRFDLAIVGAGPAGSAAATRLARAGRSVALIDKSTFPRDKFCGDGLTTLALRLLDELGFDPGSVPSWTPVSGATIRSPAGRLIELPLPETDGIHAAIARRSELDAALVDFAVAAGATPLLGEAVVGIQPTQLSVTLQLGDGASVTAGQVIAADGMWSPTRKLLGLDMDRYRGEWHAFRQYFRNVGPAAADSLWVWFEPDLLPGYMWSFPAGHGSANVGFGILRGGNIGTGSMKKLWPDLLARPHVADVLGSSAQPEAPHRAWPIPARIDGAPLTGPRTLFVGDAAAACDVLTGEGIGQALVTGLAAADAFIEHGADFDAAADSYRTAVKGELVADHRMARLLGKLLGTPAVAERALRFVDGNDWTRRNFGRWMFEDYPRALVATPRRWQRGILHRPGAFRQDQNSDA